MKELNTSNNGLYVALCIMVATACATLFFMFLTEKELMSKNIERAIEKGIDPIAVRCSYADADDKVCLAYSITHGTVDAPGARNIPTQLKK